MRICFSIVMFIFVLIFRTGNVSADFLQSQWRCINEEEYEAGITRSDTFHGSSSAYLRSRPDKSGKKGGEFGQITDVPNEWLGKRIEMTVYIKAVGVEKGAGARMSIFTDRGETLYDDMSDRRIRGNSGWNPYRIVIDVPYDAAMLAFGAWLEGRGEIRIDYFRFGITGPDEKTTGKSMQREYGSPSETGFESESDGFLPCPWSRTTEYESGVTTSDAFHGSSSAYLRSGTDKKATGSFGQIINIPKDWPGKRIRMTVYMKAVGAERGGGAYMRIYADRGEPVYDDMSERRIRGNSGWNPYRIVLDVPYDAVRAEFGAWLKGRGEIRVDYFGFGIADPDEKVTGKSRKREHTEPRNLDFESESEKQSR